MCHRHSLRITCENVTVTSFVEQKNCDASMRDFKAVTVVNTQLETKIFSF